MDKLYPKIFFLGGWEAGNYNMINVSYVHAKSLQSCLTLRNPMDHSPPGSCVHRIFQARILQWVAIPFSRGSSLPRD